MACGPSGWSPKIAKRSNSAVESTSYVCKVTYMCHPEAPCVQLDSWPCMQEISFYWVMSGVLNRPFLSTNMNPNVQIKARYARNTSGGSPYCADAFPAYFTPIFSTFTFLNYLHHSLLVIKTRRALQPVLHFFFFFLVWLGALNLIAKKTR